MSEVSLGVPAKAPESRRITNQMDVTATTIGGLPFCRDIFFFDKECPIVCRNCKKPMNFISQVYAPIGDCDRSLYIFGCNIGECYKVKKASWRCLRWQENNKPMAATKKEESVANQTISPPKTSDEILGTESFSAGSTKQWYTTADVDPSSGFGSPERDASHILGDQISTTESFAAGSVEQWDATTDLDHSLAFGGSEWSAAGMSEWGKMESMDSTSPGTKMEDFIGCNDADFGAAATSAAGYVVAKDGFTSPPLPTPQKTAGCDPEPRATRSTTKTATWDIEPSANGIHRFAHFRLRFLVHTYEEPYRHSNRMKVHVTEEVFDHENRGGETFERAPPALDSVMKFQKRLARLPRQCMRYAYGTRPLWPCPPMKLNIPPCPSCGAQRVFEMQLMPATLFHLGVDLNGMEWGSVMIFSCPKSCPTSTEEVAVAVPIDD